MPDSVIPWTTACQAPLSMGFSRQEYWSGLPCPPPGDLPDSGIKFASLTSPELAGELFTISATWEAQIGHHQMFIIKTSRWVPVWRTTAGLWFSILDVCQSHPLAPPQECTFLKSSLGLLVWGSQFENHCSEALSSHHYF